MWGSLLWASLVGSHIIVSKDVSYEYAFALSNPLWTASVNHDYYPNLQGCNSQMK